MNSGAIIGIVLSIYSIILYKLGLLITSGTGDFINYLILLVGLYYSTISYRNKYTLGFMSYGEALKFGVTVSFLASIVIGFTNYILYRFVDTSLMDQLFVYQEKVLLDSGRSADEVEEVMKLVRVGTTPGLIFLTTIFRITLFGTLISLINSIFLKRNQNPFDKAMSEIKEDEN